MATQKELDFLSNLLNISPKREQNMTPMGEDQLMELMSGAEVEAPENQEAPLTDEEVQVAAANNIVEAENAPKGIDRQIASEIEQQKASVEQPSPISRQELLLNQLKELQSGRSETLKEAREKDDRNRMIQAIIGAVPQLYAGAAAQQSGVFAAPTKIQQIEPREEARAKEDFQNQYQDMINQYKLLTRDQISPLEQKKLDLAQQRLGLQEQQFNAKQAEKVAKQGKPGEELTKGQEQLDKSFAKQYSEFVTGGGYSSVKKNLGNLQSVIDRLKEEDDITGTVREKLIPSDYVRGVVNEEAQDLKDRVEQVIQQSLRQTLGAQFTEKEAQRLIERSYNPKLSDDKNIARLEQSIQEIDEMAKAKQRAADYFEKYGTLQGYEGELDFYNGEQATNVLPANEVRRRTKDGKIAVFDKKTKEFLRYEE